MLKMVSPTDAPIRPCIAGSASFMPLMSRASSREPSYAFTCALGPRMSTPVLHFQSCPNSSALRQSFTCRLPFPKVVTSSSYGAKAKSPDATLRESSSLKKYQSRMGNWSLIALPSKRMPSPLVLLRSSSLSDITKSLLFAFAIPGTHLLDPSQNQIKLLP